MGNKQGGNVWYKHHSHKFLLVGNTHSLDTNEVVISDVRDGTFYLLAPEKESTYRLCETLMHFPHVLSLVLNLDSGISSIAADRVNMSQASNYAVGEPEVSRSLDPRPRYYGLEIFADDPFIEAHFASMQSVMTRANDKKKKLDNSVNYGYLSQADRVNMSQASNYAVGEPEVSRSLYPRPRSYGLESVADDPIIEAHFASMQSMMIRANDKKKKPDNSVNYGYLSQGDYEATFVGQSNSNDTIKETSIVEDPSGNFGSSTYKWNQMVNKQGVYASKPLLSLVNVSSDLVENIYKLLDAPIAGAGHYEVIAKYFGFTFFIIRSRFEKSVGGPSRRMIEAIAVRHPKLTVAEFARVVEKTAGREDVAALLRKYDHDSLKGSDEGVSFKPGTVSKDDILLIAHELGASWRMFGRVLNVPDAVIDQIEVDESKAREKSYRILRYWKEMYQSDATYHRLALALQHHAIERVDLAVKYCGLQFGKDVAAAKEVGSSAPAEIRGRGPEAERAFQKAMQTGKVKVYRGRIMLLGQDRAGKTSLKKSLLGLPFDPKQESTVGVEVDEVENWMPSKRKKREVSEFEDQIARFIVRDLTESEAGNNDSSTTYPDAEEVETTDQPGETKDHEAPKLLADGDESATGTEEIEDGHKALSEENLVDKNEINNELKLNINLNDVTDLVVRYLQNRLEDNIKSEEVILTLWDFAGQHLYYASHSVFLSGRAVYILVYNLNKNLLATAESSVRQGIAEISLDNPNNETNLDNLLSWLVSVHNIRSAANKNLALQGKKLSYLQPPVIIVGTNLDRPFEEVKTMEEHIKKSILDKEYVKHVRAPFFAVDNKTENDEGVQKLRQRIMEVLKDEPYMPEEVPLSWFNFERVVDALVAKETYIMELDQLLSVIRHVCYIEDEEEVTAMLNFYHDLRVIVKHGRTVVLQAQWLIDLFKQLITVPPFDEAHPVHLDCWRDLEVNGILRIALVDHVFSKFIEKGFFKQDILDMMELHGLIAKFLIVTDENQDEERYFVPTQLRSSPSKLCEIKPSECDPCPLVLRFLDGFVPHGLFPQLVSKFIHWCSENGFKKTPQLFNNGARLFIGKQITFALILICRKRFVKIVLKTRNPSSSKSLSMIASNKMAIEVRNFIERTLDGFSRALSWLSSLRYELSVVCTHCQERECDLNGMMSYCQDDRLHLLRVRPGEELICEENFSDQPVKVPRWEMWFELSHSQTKEPKEDISEAVGLDESVSFKPGTLSEDDVLLIAHELGPLWKKVGVALEVPKAVINQIEADKSEVSEKCYTVLTCWQERYPYDATYHCLALALKHPAVGRVDLAAKYCGL